MPDLAKINAFFGQAQKRVYTAKDLATIIRAHRMPWGIAAGAGTGETVDYLLNATSLHLVTLTSEFVFQPKRYLWTEASAYEVALSLKPKAYFSHGTAVYLHGLTDFYSRVLYLNQEQSAKPSNADQPLNQDAIHRAFQAPQRQSKLIYHFQDSRIQVLSGKFTNRLEVGTISTPDGLAVPVTKLERTLIDIAVRPTYAGGVYQVLEVYKACKDRISSNVLLATLRKLGYAYPYHQAIGFYLERAGGNPTTVEKLHALGSYYDFYLTHAMETTQFIEKWRLFVPKGL